MVHFVTFLRTILNFYYQFETVEEAETKLVPIYNALKISMTSRKLWLNVEKSEIMLVGSPCVLDGTED